MTITDSPEDGIVATVASPMQSSQLNEFAAALSKAQGKMENAAMNRMNPHFKSKYADLAAVIDAVRKPLSENGLAIAQTTVIRNGGMLLRTVLMHTSGQWMASEYPLPAAARPQEMGSALTYARRYSLTSLVCNSADEDDDANAAEASKQKVTPPRASTTKFGKPVSTSDTEGMLTDGTRYDARSGEIIPNASPGDVKGKAGAAATAPAEPSEGHEAADFQLAEAAKRGMEQLKAAWLALPKPMQEVCRAAIERHKETAIKVDAAEKELPHHG